MRAGNRSRALPQPLTRTRSRRGAVLAGIPLRWPGSPGDRAGRVERSAYLKGENVASKRRTCKDGTDWPIERPGVVACGSTLFCCILRNLAPTLGAKAIRADLAAYLTTELINVGDPCLGSRIRRVARFNLPAFGVSHAIKHGTRARAVQTEAFSKKIESHIAPLCLATSLTTSSRSIGHCA